jgi:16S rRNA processing protein RimM
LKNQIYVAKLGKTIGLKGLMKIHIESDFPNQFTKNAQFTTHKNTTLTVEIFNKQNNTIKFLNIDNIEDAKKLTNAELFTTKDDTKQNCKLEKNQYFWFDLVGCKIVEDDIVLGIIKDIHRYPNSDYFEIQSDDILIQKQNLSKTFLIPYDDNYIKNVDILSKTIIAKNAFDILKAS